MNTDQLYTNIQNGAYNTSGYAEVGAARQRAKSARQSYEAADKVARSSGLSEQARQAQTAYVQAMKEEWDQAQAEYDKLSKDYHERARKAEDQFRRDVLEAFELADHPKADRIWNFVREKSDGSTTELLSWLEDIADLVA